MSVPRGHRLVLVLSTLLVCGVLDLVSARTLSPSSAAEPVRILVVGDSVTQGSSGDWTWRYRLARYLDDAAVSYDLVGPRTALRSTTDDTTDTDQSYAEPDFDTDHFARWGGTFHFTLAADAPTEQDSIGWAVATYHPDVVVEALGINDLTYFTSPAATVDAAREFVAEVRAAKPDTAVVVSTVTRRGDTYDAYNAALRDQGPGWSTEESPVVVADPAADWVGGTTDTWDDSHPNARGEVKIAAAEADALARLDVGRPAARPLPDVPVGPTRVATLAAAPADGQAELSWTDPPGATAEYVWRRDLTAGQPWQRLPYALTGSAWTAGGLTNGHTYAFRLQATKGSATAEDRYSDVVTATPDDRPPGAVGGLTAARPAYRQLAVSWTRVPRASGYTVTWCRAGVSACGRRDVTDASAVLEDLVAGADYTVRVSATNYLGAGPASTLSAVPTGAVPGAVSLRSLTSSTTHRVRVAYDAVPDATRYEVLYRYAGTTAWRSLGFVTGTSYTTGPLRAGRTVAVKVRSWDQYVRGGTGSGSVRVR